MRLFQKTKDGGKDSTVDAFFLIELKGLFSIALLRFNKGSRVNYHSHAFKAWTWFLAGDMVEHRLMPDSVHPKESKYKRSLFPKITSKDNLHKVIANTTSWCFTVRGPWSDQWVEFNQERQEKITLTHGRKVISTCAVPLSAEVNNE